MCLTRLGREVVLEGILYVEIGITPVANNSYTHTPPLGVSFNVD
jgi:hypothetical protein